MRWVGLLLLLAPVGFAATLQTESVKAWDRYVATAEANFEKCAEQGATFLWVDESPARKSRVRGGDVVVFENRSNPNKRAPNALIHDWMGAAFIPGAKLEDVLSTVRDYEKYTDYYSPSVVRAQTLNKTANTDQFSILLMNQALVLKTAIESEYQSTLHWVSENRVYSKSVSTRIQEIEDYGRDNEHRLPVGEGSGYLWRIATLTRYEQRDGGVYVETEAMVLSRDVPVSLRFIVDPIIRRVSRNSMMQSLKQTDKAVSEVMASNHGFSKSAAETTDGALLRQGNALRMTSANR